MAKQDETLLILLDYLMNYTDENHLSVANEINNYALDTYGVPIDHRCIKTNLERLKELCDKYPDKFPFKLESNNGERPKYYIKQKYFSRDEILSIASAIKDTFQIDPVASQDLINRFVEVTTNFYEKENILNIIKSQPKKGGKIKPTTANVVKQIELAIREKRQITYTMKYSEKPVQYTDYFYKVIYIGTNPIAIIIRNGELISLYAKHIKIIRVELPWYDDPRCKFQIKNQYHGSYEDPDAEIEAKMVPNTNALLTRTCFFEFDNRQFVIDTVKESFDAFFPKPLVYSIIGGKCYAKVTTKIEIFLEWATQYRIAKLITVTGDSEVLFQMVAHYKDVANRCKLN